MKPTLFQLNFCSRRTLGVLLCVLFARVVFAQTYINENKITYNVSPEGPFLPQFDDTAFVNQSVFTVNYNNIAYNQMQFCEPWWGTLYYTNNGEMIVNAGSVVDNGGGGTGVGFMFALQQTNSNTTSTMADTFYNPGVIHCDSALDGNNEAILEIDGVESLTLESIGDCFVSATNIINPGTIELGDGGQLNLSGQNVDLSQSVLTLETGENIGTVAGNAPFTGTRVFGLNTNWDPSADLEPPIAISGPFFPTAPGQLFLTNAVPYAEANVDPSTGDNVYRFVYIQDTSVSNVSYSVYLNTGPSVLGDGEATIQWAGAYIDPATGQYFTNYLYLNDDIVGGSSTNVALNNPFTLTESGVPIPVGTASVPDLPYSNIFPSGPITNLYSFEDFESINVSETNPSVINPSGALTNLPNRVIINASQDLKLANAQISGQLYMSLQATNQFDGSSGALIASPYSDINLGVTNGSLTVSNLLESQFLEWNGTIQAWSSRWLEVVTNTIGTNIVAVTNDYRVLIVSSQLNPISTPQVQNLALNASNNLVIADELNVLSSIFATPQSMTVTSNALDNGATSPMGELNLENANSSTWSWSGSFPNLLWLTNNGAIVVPNFSDLIGNAQTNAMMPGSNAIAATAILSESGGKNVAKLSQVTFGNDPPYTYTFTNKISKKSPPYYVLIGPNFNASMTNLISAINHGPGANKVYSTNTYASIYVTAGVLTNNLAGTNRAFKVTAIYAGVNGTNIVVSTTATNLTWSSLNLAGGVDAAPPTTNAVAFPIPYGAVINNGFFSSEGTTIWVNNFENGGTFTNGVGSFTLDAQTATLTNGSLFAGGDISITANTLETSNLLLQAGRSLTLQVTNWLTDDGVSNANTWVVGSTNATGFNLMGLGLPFLPANTTPGLNNLLGTTISMQSPPPNKQVASAWAGLDYGVSTNGYTTNNVAIGQLILDSIGPSSVFYFTGTGSAGVSNAMYVDRLVLEDYASYTNGLGTESIPTLQFNPNLVIYYADAIASGEDVSYQLNNSNHGHLRWVPQYVGIFSATNLIYGDGTTHVLNAGLVNSPRLDSTGRGIPNAKNSSPIFVSSELNFQCFATTNSKEEIIWDSIPSATNTVFYATNIMSPNWVVLTNFVSPTNVPPVNGWPITNVLVEPLNSGQHGFYRVRVNPNSASLYGE